MTVPHGAADSLTGYLYQVRAALLWSLRRLRGNEDFIVALETLDDVTFQTSGVPSELLQTKHHRRRTAKLTDSSADLWKSLRVWLDGLASREIPPGARLYLLTTAVAQAGSAAAYLRPQGRDVRGAAQRLEGAARSSTSKANAQAYAAFLAISDEDRMAILSNVFIIDAAPSVGDLHGDIASEIRWAMDRRHEEAFLDRLEGWWMRRVLKQLATTAATGFVLSAEIEAQMSDLREQFKQDSLPIDEDLLDIDLDDASYAAYPFVLQLELISAGTRRIAAAVRDYYRAFEQRSRWLRDDLILVGDLGAYEKRLLEEWELVFEAICDELGETATDAVKKQAARKVLAWAEQTSIPIRPKVTEPFVTRGSLHMLADDQRLGWHPEFRDLLEKVLASTGALA